MDISKGSKKILSPEEITAVFSTIEVIHRLNGTICADIEKEIELNGNSPRDLLLGGIFLRMVSENTTLLY